MCVILDRRTEINVNCGIFSTTSKDFQVFYPADNRRKWYSMFSWMKPIACHFGLHNPKYNHSCNKNTGLVLCNCHNHLKYRLVFLLPKPLKNKDQYGFHFSGHSRGLRLNIYNNVHQRHSNKAFFWCLCFEYQIITYVYLEFHYYVSLKLIKLVTRSCRLAPCLCHVTSHLQFKYPSRLLSLSLTYCLCILCAVKIRRWQRQWCYELI